MVDVRVGHLPTRSGHGKRIEIEQWIIRRKLRSLALGSGPKLGNRPSRPRDSDAFTFFGTFDQPGQTAFGSMDIDNRCGHSLTLANQLG